MVGGRVEREGRREGGKGGVKGGGSEGKGLMFSSITLRVIMSLFSLISLCDRYDEISTKVYGDPQSTEDMVQLVQFLNTVSPSHWCVWGRKGLCEEHLSTEC